MTNEDPRGWGFRLEPATRPEQGTKLDADTIDDYGGDGLLERWLAEQDGTLYLLVFYQQRAFCFRILDPAGSPLAEFPDQELKDEIVTEMPVVIATAIDRRGEPPAWAVEGEVSA